MEMVLPLLVAVMVTPVGMTFASRGFITTRHSPDVALAVAVCFSAGAAAIEMSTVAPGAAQPNTAGRSACKTMCDVIARWKRKAAGAALAGGEAKLNTNCVRNTVTDIADVIRR